MQDQISITDHILSHKNTPLGILLPCTFFGTSSEGSTIVWGPKGALSFNDRSEKHLLEALEKSGALLRGKVAAQNQVQQLLLSPQHSRNASFFSCNAKDCEELNAAIEEVAKASVMIIGCGGIGSNAAMILAGAGIRKFILVDSDSIEESNLNRQLFWEKKDIGKSKTHALREKLNERFDHCEVDGVVKKIDLAWIKENAGRAKCIIIAADEPETLVGSGPSIAAECGVHVFGAGYTHHMATVTHSPPNSNIEVEIAETKNRVQWRRSPNAIMPSYGPTNVLLAALIASRLIQALIHKIPTFSTQTDSWDPIHLLLESSNSRIMKKKNDSTLNLIDITPSIRLRAISKKDAVTIKNIASDNRPLGTQHFAKITNRLEEVIQFCQFSEERFENTDATYAIESNQSLIGLISLTTIDYINKTSDIDYWPRTNQDIQAIIPIAINSLVNAYSKKIRRFSIKLTAEENNILASIKNLEFNFEGTLRQAQKMGSKYVDQCIYSKIL